MTPESSDAPPDGQDETPEAEDATNQESHTGKPETVPSSTGAKTQKGN